MNLQVAGLTEDSVVDGTGLRLTIFCQGCNKHPHCKGCHNPETWSKTGGIVMAIEEIKNKISENPLLDGITFSGGEPFDQPKPLIELAQYVHSINKNVWAFSGWTLEELSDFNNPDINMLLENIDVLVEGRFIPQLKDLHLVFRGSSNQKIIDMKNYRKLGKKVELNL